MASILIRAKKEIQMRIIKCRGQFKKNNIRDQLVNFLTRLLRKTRSRQQIEIMFTVDKPLLYDVGYSCSIAKANDISHRCILTRSILTIPINANDKQKVTT